jgi:3-phenylpropionate/trans-cinnamate dioxygenase ferredoxin reductase subunit
MVGPGLPHDRPPLSKHALITGVLPTLADAGMLREQNIRHIDGVVRAWDHRKRVAELDIGASGLERRKVVGPLVWATGLGANRLGLAAMAHDENTTGLGFSMLAPKLVGPRRRVIVIGAGLIGVETAATLSARHDVVLVDVTARPLERFHDPIPRLASETISDLGVTFLAGCRIERGVTDGRGICRLETDNYGELVGDVVILAVGVGSSLPRGLSSNGSATLPVDDQMRVRGASCLWACGDCATVSHPRLGNVWFPHWDWARRSGEHAAASVLGLGGSFDAEPFWFSSIGPLHLHEVGFAALVERWDEANGLYCGRDRRGRVVAVLLVNQVRRLNEARALLG